MHGCLGITLVGAYPSPVSRKHRQRHFVTTRFVHVRWHTHAHAHINTLPTGSAHPIPGMKIHDISMDEAYPVATEHSPSGCVLCDGEIGDHLDRTPIKTF